MDWRLNLECSQPQAIDHKPLRRMVLYPAVVIGMIQGCSSAPKSFLSVSDPAAINRARAVAFGNSQSDAVAIPVLIDRLTDDDPVVRLASHESLKKRTGQDFGYLPYAEGDELANSVGRWRQWWSASQNGRMFAGSQPMASPQASPQVMPRQAFMTPKAVSEASFRERRGLFRRIFDKR